MDIITHALSGVAIGTSVVSFSNKNIWYKFGLIGMAGFGAVLPDFDVISLWSKFDVTIGRFFGLENSGQQIYYSKFWYSHHGFLHSLLACIIIAFVCSFLIFLFVRRFKIFPLKSLISLYKNKSFYFIAFIFGFIIHLLEDMPTPAYVWGGVNLFWPSKQYVGGTGDIWWWNNYDIFLIVVSLISLNGLAYLVNRFKRLHTRKITVFILFLGFGVSLFQIKTRDFDFNYTNYAKKSNALETKSKEIQREMLGDKLYNFMIWFDNKIPLNF